MVRTEPNTLEHKSDEGRFGIRRLLRLARPEARLLGFGTFFLIASSGMLLGYPQLVRVIIDEALGTGDIGRINRAAGVILVLFVVLGLAGALRYWCFTIAGERIVATLRRDLYRAIIGQEIAFFDARRTGELVSRLASDSTVLQNAVSVNISMLVRNAASAAGGLGMLIYTSPALALATLSAIPPIAVGVAWFGKRVRRLSRDVQDAIAAAGVVAEETISGVRTVRAFAQEPREAARYAASIDASFAVSKRKITGIAWFTAAASVLGYSAIVGVVWYGARMVIAKELSVGELMSFVLYTLGVAVSVGTLGSLWTDFMGATGAARRIFELLDREPAIPLTGGLTLAKIDGRVSFEGVTFAYPARPDIEVLHAVNLELAPGDLVALVGPSGGGKSTIAALIPRFYDVSAGVVKIDGHDVRALDGSALRRSFGIVAQDPVLVSTTIAENIRYGRAEASDEAVREAAVQANVHDFVTAFPEGYQTVVGERGIQLSGGQKQRLAIARAILRDPRILILDEATSALDAESERLVKEALDRLMRGRTTIVIAHRLSTVKDAGRVLVVDAGRIVEQGTHAELMRRDAGLYRRLVERQFFQG